MKMMVSATSDNDGRSFVPVTLGSLLGQVQPGQYVQRSQLPSGFSESFDPNWVAPEYVPSPVMVYAPAASPVKAVVPVITADDFRKRQRYAESGFNDKAVSKAGAKGAYQIMPDVLSDYIAATGKKGDLFDYEYNKSVRDWYVDWLMNRPVVNGNGNKQSDVNTLAKMAAAYNWGVGNLTDYLVALKNKGVDIYNSTDWVEGLNPETRDYVKFVALQQDTTGPRTTEAFNKAMAKYNLASDGGRIRTLADKLMEKGYYSDGGKIYIKPSKRGTFKAQATKMGMGVKEAAHHVLAHKEDYSPAMVKKATFAANFAADGGTMLRPYNKFEMGGPENGGAYWTPYVQEGGQEFIVNPELASALAANQPVAVSQQPAVVETSMDGLSKRRVPLGRRTVNREYSEPVQYADATGVANASPYDIVVENPVAGLSAKSQIAEGVALGGKERDIINGLVGQLKSGDDLRDFQRELFRGGYYRDLKTPEIKARTKSEVEDLQRMLRDAGYDIGSSGANGDGVDGKIGNKTRAAWAQYAKDHPDQAMEDSVADGRIGNATRAAARRYYEDQANSISAPVPQQVAPVVVEEPVAVARQPISEPLPAIQDDSLLSFPEYMYKSGQVGGLRRAGNVMSVARNFVNGMLNPHGSNATMSEGARRQMLGASLAHYDNTGKYGIEDVDHEALGGISAHSGIEFREDQDRRGYVRQAADAPYHNIYGQSGSTYNPVTGVFSPGVDAYTFNNVWDGSKVTKVMDDGEGTGTISDAYAEYVRARESGATAKAAMESAASIRGVAVKPKEGRSNAITEKKLEKYRKEYEGYLNDEKKRKRFERKYNRAFGVKD